MVHPGKNLLFQFRSIGDGVCSEVVLGVFSVLFRLHWVFLTFFSDCVVAILRPCSSSFKERKVQLQHFSVAVPCELVVAGCFGETVV